MDTEYYGVSAWKELGFPNPAAWVEGTRLKVEQEQYGAGFVLDDIRQRYLDNSLAKVAQDSTQAAPKAKARRKEKAAPKAHSPTPTKASKKRKGVK